MPSPYLSSGKRDAISGNLSDADGRNVPENDHFVPKIQTSTKKKKKRGKRVIAIALLECVLLLNEFRRTLLVYIPPNVLQNANTHYQYSGSFFAEENMRTQLTILLGLMVLALCLCLMPTGSEAYPYPRHANRCPHQCGIYCPCGNIMDNNNCPTCRCRPSNTCTGRHPNGRPPPFKSNILY